MRKKTYLHSILCTFFIITAAVTIHITFTIRSRHLPFHVGKHKNSNIIWCTLWSLKKQEVLALKLEGQKFDYLGSQVDKILLKKMQNRAGKHVTLIICNYTNLKSSSKRLINFRNLFNLVVIISTNQVRENSQSITIFPKNHDANAIKHSYSVSSWFLCAQSQHRRDFFLSKTM